MFIKMRFIPSVALMSSVLLTMFTSKTFVHCGGGNMDPMIDEMRRALSTQLVEEQQIKSAGGEGGHGTPGRSDQFKSVLSDGFKSMSRRASQGVSGVNQFVVSPARTAAKKTYDAAQSGATSAVGTVRKVYGRVTERAHSSNAGTVESAATNEAQQSADSPTREGSDDDQQQQRGDDHNERSVADQELPNQSAENTNAKPMAQSGEGGSNATGGISKGCPLRGVPTAAKHFGTMAGTTVGPPLKNAAGKVVTTVHSGVQVVHHNVVEPAYNTVLQPVVVPLYNKALKPVAKASYNTVIVPTAQGISTAARTVSSQLDRLTEWKEDEQHTAAEAEQEEKHEKKDEGTTTKKSEVDE